MSFNYLDEFYEHPNKKMRDIFSNFLKKQGLEYEKNIELTLKVVDKSTGNMIGTGSIDGKIIKCLAIDEKRRGEGLSSHILSILVKEQFKRGRNHIFIFTHPRNVVDISSKIFTGFNIIAKTDQIALLEMGSQSINEYINQLTKKTIQIKKRYKGIIGSVVVNCNPFTLGHQYLIETAVKECSFLYVFVVSEDQSVFPTNIRMKLIQAGTNHIKNVLVLEGGEYIISSATFPRYFIKNYNDISLEQARLDVTIFANYIAPALGIQRRYVGEEPYSQVTKAYNQAMQEILIPKGIELKIIPRKEFNHEAISASKVRVLIQEGKIQETINLIPKTTYDFLLSDEAKPIIKKLQKSK